MRAALQLIAGGATVGDEAAPYARAAVLGRVWQGFGVDGVRPDRFMARQGWVGRFRQLRWVHTWERSPRPLAGLRRGAPLSWCCPCPAGRHRVDLEP